MVFVEHITIVTASDKSQQTRMIKNLKGIGIEGIHYAATKSKETRNKILALASTKDSGWPEISS